MGNMMANQSGGRTDGNRATIAAEANDTAAMCRADDLRDLLERITQQIADSDKRQTDALSEMLGRLETLGAEARSYKGKVPAAFLPAFERIEDGVNMLAERIASVRDVTAAEFVPAEPAVPASATVSADAENPNITAAPAAAPAAPSEMAPSPVAATVAAATALYDDDTVLPNDESAWDREAAEALARHYEGTVAGYAGPMPDPERAAVRHTATARKNARGIDVERVWLEERFADIAKRIEASLAESAPDNSFSELGDRFDQLEQRFGSALDGVAQRSDVEGLRILEAHITELTQQFDDTRMQLGRLDGIEQTLSAVVDRLTDPRFDEVLARGGAASETDLEPLISAAVEQIATRLKGSSENAHIDFAGIADAAAERVASRFADFNQADRSGGGEVHTIRQLLEHFINERREGDEQTAAMLDTMQQAMIRVLDRVDNIEVAQSKSTPQEYVREQVRFGVDAASGAASGAHKAADAATAFAAEARGTISYEPRKSSAAERGIEEDEYSARPFVAEPQIAAARMPAAPAPIPMTTHQAAPQPANPADATAAGSATNRSAGATIERLRSDFIADAQRAKQKAAAATVDTDTKRNPGAAAEPAAAAVPLSSARARQAAAGAAASNTEGASSRFATSRMPSRKILVSALVLLVAIPGIIVLAQKRAARSGNVAPTAAAIEAPAAAAAKSMSADAPAGSTTRDTAATTAERNPTAEPAAVRSNEMAPSSRDDSTGRAVDADREGSDKSAPRVNVDQVGQSSTPAPATDAPAVASSTADARTAEIAAMPAGPIGIHVATPGKPPTLDQLHRLQQRQSMAELSSKLGAAQPANATLASLIPDAGAAAAGLPSMPSAQPPTQGSMTPATAAAGGMAMRKPLDLPAASVGPLSLRMAAANGDASAEFEVGARFAEGNGVAQDFAEASRWYQRSATQGFAQAQYRLATLYERGLGVKQDANRAKVWYGRAAEGGNIKAMHNLAVLSAGRTAKTPDYAAAATWFEAAAERGLADSQFNLAVLFDGGLGVGKDLKVAYKWFALAASGGDQEAVRRRDDMERTMLPADLAAARKLVSAWNAKAADKLANDARAAGEEWKKRARASGDI